MFVFVHQMATQTFFDPINGLASRGVEDVRKNAIAQNFYFVYE